MRIGVFDPYLDDLGGGEKYMMMLASCLSKQHDVTVFWDNSDDIAALKKRFGLSFEKIAIAKNIFSPTVGLFERARMARRFDAIVYLSDGSIPFVFPSKLFIHVQQPLPRRNFSFKEKIKLKYITKIFYNSQFTKRFNDPLFRDAQATVIYPPVSFAKREKQKEKRENVIIHVGRFRVKNLAIEDYKKQGFMVDTFKKLIDSGLKGWKFVLVSSVRKEDETKFHKLQKNAKGYPISFQINKSNKELIDLYERSKIYWHASGYGEDLNKYPELAEHFGITTVEAMGAGVVPVVINSGGQKEIITDGKNGLLWNTREELLQLTRRLANDEKLWHTLSQQAMIRARDFTEEKFCEAVLHIIK